MRPRTLRPPLTLAFLVVGALAAAQTADAPAAATPPADSATPTVDAAAQPAAEMVTITVVLAGGPEQPADDDQPIPVRLHVVSPPHEVLETVSRPLDADDRVTFEVPARPGTEAVAEVVLERRFFSDPVPLDTPGPRTITIEAMTTTSDPSVLYARSVHTILELWEGYVTVTQAWTLDVREPVVFVSRNQPDGRPDFATLAMFPLPAEAEGVNVIRPEGTARVTGTTVAASLEIGPRSAGDRRGSDVVVQYSIPYDRTLVEWTQPLSMDAESFTIIVPQESSHTRHPVLDVEILTAPCDDPTRVCLQASDDRSDIPLRADVPARVVRGSGTAGQQVHVATTGWPSRLRWERKAAAGAGILIFVGVVVMFLRDRRARPEDPRQMRVAALEAQRESLFEAAAELDRRLDDGLVLERDHEVQMERIRQQLGVIYRRLREIDAGTESAAHR